MTKVLTAIAGLSLMLASGLAAAQSGTGGGAGSGTGGGAGSGTGGGISGTGGSGTAATGVDVIGALILAGNPSVTRSKVGGLANALCRITKSC